jgi:integrase/recombinase XerC
MGYLLSHPYNSIYDNYLRYERTKRSNAGIISIKSMAFLTLKYFEEKEMLPCEVSVLEAIEYKSYLSELKSKEGSLLSRGTINNYIKSVRGIFNYLVLTEELKSNPFLEITYLREEEVITNNVLGIEELEKLFNYLRDFNSITDYKAHVLSEFLYSTGMRIAEAASLTPSDIDLTSRRLYLKEGKGGEGRICFLTGYVSDVLKLYMDRGRDVLIKNVYSENEERLFLSSHQSLDKFLNKKLKKACLLLEIPIITAHGLRHCLGTHLLKSGCDLRHIQKILGHRGLAATQVYTHLDKEDLKNSLDKHHPRKLKGKV